MLQYGGQSAQKINDLTRKSPTSHVQVLARRRHLSLTARAPGFCQRGTSSVFLAVGGGAAGFPGSGT